MISGPAGTIPIQAIEQIHGRISSLGFRTHNLAYCNDVSGLPEKALAHLEGLEVLVVDALRYDPHPSHSHLDQTLKWIELLKPKRAVLTNLHIDMDYQSLRAELPSNVEPGYDGMEIEL